MNKIIRLMWLSVITVFLILTISSLTPALGSLNSENLLTANPNISLPEITSSTNNAANLETLTGKQIFWILIVAILGPQVVILCVFLGPFIWGEKLDERAKYLSEVLPRLIEGTTILLIISTIIFLGLLKVTLPEGTLSLLSAIAGYVLGKGQSSVTRAKAVEPIGESQETNHSSPNMPL